jgi:hypothetical protein
MAFGLTTLAWWRRIGGLQFTGGTAHTHSCQQGWVQQLLLCLTTPLSACCGCRRNDRAWAFLLLLRQSQLYEVFIQERLQMTASSPGGPEYSGTCTSAVQQHLHLSVVL